MFERIGRSAAVLALCLAAGAWLGCEKKTTEPIVNLDEQQKQQVQELNEQRASEWGQKPK